MAEYRQFWRHHGSTGHFVPVIMFLRGGIYSYRRLSSAVVRRPQMDVSARRETQEGRPVSPSQWWSAQILVRRGPTWSDVVQRGPPSDPAVWTWCLTETMPHLASVMEDDH